MTRHRHLLTFLIVSKRQHVVRNFLQKPFRGTSRHINCKRGSQQKFQQASLLSGLSHAKVTATNQDLLKQKPAEGGV